MASNFDHLKEDYHEVLAHFQTFALLQIRGKKSWNCMALSLIH